MWPWGHLGSGYLLYAGLSRLRGGSHKTGASTWAVALGSQCPDLVDKPLAWSLDVLPNGRSLGHSAVIGVVVLGCLLLLASHYRKRELGIAFGVGYLAHLAGDALYPALEADAYSLGFLFWPVVPPVEYTTPQSFLAYITQLSLGPRFWFETGLFLVAGLVWYFDGAKGLPRRSGRPGTEPPESSEHGD